MVVNTATLGGQPAFGKALVGAWYETLAIMRASDEAGIAARTAMAEASGTDLAGFDAQLDSTRMFWDAEGGGRVHRQPEAGRDHGPCAHFSNGKGLMGGDMDAVGIAFPGGRTWAMPAASSCASSTST